VCAADRRCVLREGNLRVSGRGIRRLMNADTSRLRILGRTTAVLAVLALINGVRLAAGTTTIGTTTVAAHFESDTRVLIAVAAFGVAAASQVGTRTRSQRMARAAAVAVAGSGAAALAEVWRCVGHWHSQAARAAVALGYPASAAHNHYGRGIQVVVAGGLIAIAAALVIAAWTRTPPTRLGLQEQFPT
jgi:hypothetical protein